MKILMATHIEMLLECAKIDKKDKSLEEYDSVFEELEEDKRRQLESYMDQMANQEAARGEGLYWERLYDGIRLMAKITKIPKTEAEP